MRPNCDFPELIELEEMHGVKLLSSYGLVQVELFPTQIEYSNKVDTNVTAENCTFIGISKMLKGEEGNDLHLHKQSPINLFFLISNPESARNHQPKSCVPAKSHKSQ